MLDILVLEDSTNRINYFLERFSDCNLTITENAQDAIYYLENNVFDCIFLDNDLGPNDGCGADVAYFLSEEYNQNRDATIIIHSWNLPAALAMVDILHNAVFVPFGSADFYELDICNRSS